MVHDVRTGLVNSEVEFPSALLRHREMVQSALRRALPPNGDHLYDMLRYHLGWIDVRGRLATSDSGKALRPTLSLLACEWAGGDGQNVLPGAVALELLHNFSLIHDDVQDGDTERRHRPTVWYVWGKPKAILAGDAMHCLSDRALLALGEEGKTPDGVAVEMSRSLTEGCLEMIEGQYLDLSFENRLDVTVDQYLDMIGRKTGALMACAMFMGALAATSDVGVARTFGRCGRLTGLAFQIRDDLLGVWGDSHNTGKATGADLQRRKKSLPAVYALERAAGDDGERLRRVYSQDTLSHTDVLQVLEIMDRLDTYNFGQRLAEGMAQEALSAVAELSLSQQARQELQEVITFIVHRQR